MSLRRNVLQLRNGLKHSQLQRHCNCPPALHRAYTTETATAAIPSSDDVRDYAILGGGITGLATAYYLSRELPNAKISLYEASPHVGGWIQSKLVNVGTGDVIFERGPRSLRPRMPNGAFGIQLAQELGLLDDLLITPRSAAAARRRYVYFPDHLVKMPGEGMGLWELVKTVLFEPVFLGLPSAVLGERSVAPRPVSLTDESVGDFVARRLHASLADNLVSAVFHGIYAGDIYRLSAKSVLAPLWAREEKWGTLTTAVWRAQTANEHWEFMDDIEMSAAVGRYELDPEARLKMEQCSVYTFRYGMEQLVEALERWLEGRPNVRIYKNAKVVDLAPAQQAKDAVQLSVDFTGSSDSPNPDPMPAHLASHVISTISSQDSAFISPKLAENSASAVTVSVVNLYYAPPDGKSSSIFSTSNHPDLHGFGYLIPQSVPFSHNPERALGVVFDSDITPDYYTTVPPEKLGTRLTVMLGGHWWDGWTEYPSDEEAADMAQKVLARHLGIMTKPVLCQAKLQRNCIPQYHVGHSQRMLEAHDDILSRWKGRVRVAGSWYTGVGINDCLRAAHDLTSSFKAEVSTKRTALMTGLEKVAKRRKMARIQTYKHQGDQIVKIMETD